LVALCLLFVTTSCLQSEPEPPSIKPFDPAPVQQVSHLSFPLSLDLGEIESKINSEVGSILYEDLDMKPDGLKVVVKRAGKLRIRALENELLITAPLVVWAEFSLDKKLLGIRSRKTKETDFLIDVNLSSPFSLDTDWRLITDFRLNEIQWKKDPSVNLAFLKLNVKPFVESALLKSEDQLLEQINKAIKDKVPLKQPIEKVWRSIQNPILINRELSKVWLIVEPQSISTGSPKLSSDAITIPIDLELLLSTKLGSDSVPGFVPLPKRGELLSNADYGFSLQVLSSISYHEINDILEETVSGRTLYAEGNEITIDSVSVFGSGQKVFLRTKVKGSYDGVIYLSGYPRYDTLNNYLSFDKLDYDISTQELLVKTADWMFHEDIIESLREHSSFQVSDQLKRLPYLILSAVEKGKVGEKITLKIDNMEVSPERIVVGPEQLWVVINSSGKVGITLDKL
jgi:hypothetical protein